MVSNQQIENILIEGLKRVDTGSQVASLVSSTNTSTSSLFSLNRASSSSISRTFTDIDEDALDPAMKIKDVGHVTNARYLSQGSSLSIQFGNKRHNVNHKFCVVLIGLPATGKSTISRDLINFLHSSEQTSQLRCSIFNAGNVRRKLSVRRRRPTALSGLGEMNKSEDDLFNPKNAHKKEEYAKITLSKLFEEVSNDQCDVAIFDATNSTLARRDFIIEQIRDFNKLHYDNQNNIENSGSKNMGTTPIHITPIFLQVSCNDPSFIKFNIHNKSFNQDYFDKPYEFAVRDFAKRLKQYHSQFVPFRKSEFEGYCKANAVANHGCHNPNFGLFFFHIVDAGQYSSNDENLYYFPSQYCSDTAELINVIEYFIQNYSKMYGFKYIERAIAFNKGKALSPPDTGVDKISASVRDSSIRILNDVINDQYFKSL